jgi:hypothetical protein
MAKGKNAKAATTKPSILLFLCKSRWWIVEAVDNRSGE